MCARVRARIIYIILFLNTFKTSRQFSRDPLGLPKTWEFDAYETVWRKFYVHVNTATEVRKPIGIFMMLFNSLVYALGGAVMMSGATCLMAYITAQYRYKISDIITTGVIVLMALPIIGSEPSQIRVLQ